jgi:outer membrane immunogenic protein
MQHRLSIATIAVASTVAVMQIASAADLPRKAPAYSPPPPPLAYNWTGFYVGVNAGGAWGRSDVSLLPPGVFTPQDVAILQANAQPRFDPAGFTGGGQVGYNWQINNFLLGLESDINYIGLKETVTSPVFPGFALFVAAQSTASMKTDWLFTLRPRAGLTVNNWLFYVTGGLAVGNEKFAQSIFFPASGSVNAGSVSKTNAGWTVGGGAEWAFAGNWSAKLEYLYVDLGSVSFTSLNSVVGANATFVHSADLRENIVRLGLNYRFSGPGGARY